jgi:hypothetical protein
MFKARKSIATIVVVIGAIVLFNWLVSQPYRVARNQALEAFKYSRNGRAMDIDSYEFVSHGVQCGMTAAEVDEQMEGAIKKSGWMREVDSDRFERYYEFAYGPEYKPPFGKATPIIQERLTVIFNEQRTAIRLQRDLFLKNDASRTGVTEWDLCTGTAIPNRSR